MIELKCWGCGWDLHVHDHSAGLRVVCRRCGDTTMVPDSVTQEVDIDCWNAAFDPASESETALVDASSRGGLPMW